MKETAKALWAIAMDFSWFFKPVGVLILWTIIDRLTQFLVLKLDRVTFSRIRKKVKSGRAQKSVAFRARTLGQLTSQAVRGVVVVVMGFWFMDSLGIDMRPVLAGVGVVGIGLSLAAQNIIRDYLNGFLILVEDQFDVGDYITIGAQSGTVEYFSLRITRLRDIAGNLITIPNSAIQMVVNANKNWSAAVVDLSITYESDYKKAMDLSRQVAGEIAADAANKVIDEPTVQGINSFGDNAVVLRVILKTAPGEHWSAGRLFRAKIKEAFDAQGIDLAYPQLVIHGKGGTADDIGVGGEDTRQESK